MARDDIETSASPIRWPSILLGAWLILAPFILGYPGVAATWNDVLVGIAVIAIAFAASYAPEVRWLNTALGAWLIIAPWVIGYAFTRATWNDVIVGILVVVFSLAPGVERTGGRREVRV